VNRRWIPADNADREVLYRQWKKAVNRSFDWL
jgi:hypothetical protein